MFAALLLLGSLHFTGELVSTSTKKVHNKDNTDTDVVSSIHKGQFCFVGAIEEICRIKEHPTSQVVDIGDSVTLMCSTESDGRVIDWLFGPDGERIDHSKYQLINDASQLFIERFEASHAGTYRCIVEMDGLGNCVSRAATLKYIDCELNDILDMTLLLVLQTVLDFK